MGEVKDTVKGTPPAKHRKAAGDSNVVQQLIDLQDTVSDLTAIKDNDVLNEGDDQKSENQRKAGMLRATHSLITAARTLMEDY